MWKETPTGRREKPGAHKTRQKATRRARRRWCHGGSKRGEVKHKERGQLSVTRDRNVNVAQTRQKSTRRARGFIEAGNRAPVDTATATLPRMMNAEATDVDGN